MGRAPKFQPPPGQRVVYDRDGRRWVPRLVPLDEHPWDAVWPTGWAPSGEPVAGFGPADPDPADVGAGPLVDRLAAARRRKEIADTLWQDRFEDQYRDIPPETPQPVTTLTGQAALPVGDEWVVDVELGREAVLADVTVVAEHHPHPDPGLHPEIDDCGMRVVWKAHDYALDVLRRAGIDPADLTPRTYETVYGDERDTVLWISRPRRTGNRYRLLYAWRVWMHDPHRTKPVTDMNQEAHWVWAASAEAAIGQAILTVPADFVHGGAPYEFHHSRVVPDHLVSAAETVQVACLAAWERRFEHQRVALLEAKGRAQQAHPSPTPAAEN